jgi:hypothetical protein
MYMLKNTRKQAQIDIEDLDPVAAANARELKFEDLNLVVGGTRVPTGYVCTATPGGVSEDCWRE